MGASLTNYASQRPSPPDLWIWFSDSLNCIIFCSIAGCHKWTQECALYDQFESIFPNRPFLFSSSNISKHLFPSFSIRPTILKSIHLRNVTSIKFRDEFVTKSRRENTRLKGGRKKRTTIKRDHRRCLFFLLPFFSFFDAEHGRCSKLRKLSGERAADAKGKHRGGVIFFTR